MDKLLKEINGRKLKGFSTPKGFWDISKDVLIQKSYNDELLEELYKEEMKKKIKRRR